MLLIRDVSLCNISACFVLVATSLSNAAVPASVAIRQQTPEIEQIIQDLETKAHNSTGTWNTRSGRQDAPGESFSFVIDGSRWGWQSNMAPPSPSSTFSMYCDGEYCYRMSDLRRFQQDTLERGNFQNFRLGQEILLANLAPRQFLCAIGKLSVVGKKKVGDVECTHLQWSPAQDEVLALDGDVATRYEPLPTIDVVYDPSHVGIVQMGILDKGGGERVEMTVLNWDRFGTGSNWPKALAGRTFVGDSNSKEIGKPFVTTVETFQRQEIRLLGDLQKRAESVRFFPSTAPDFRSQSFYQKALQAKGSLSDRVALAQASFIKADARVGLEQWKIAEGQLISANDRSRLSTSLIALAGYCLAESPKDPDQRDSSIELMSKILKTGSPADIHKVGVSVLMAWRSLYEFENTRSLIAAQTDNILGTLIRNSSRPLFSQMRTLAQKPAFQAVINPYLQAAAALPVTRDGYSTSPVAHLVSATLDARDVAAARAYLQNINWDPTTDDESKVMVAAIVKGIDQSVAIKGHQRQVFSAAISSCTNFSEGPYQRDTETAHALLGLILETSSKEMGAILTENPDGGRALFVTSAGVKGAKEFWGSVLEGVLVDPTRKPHSVIELAGPALKAYGEIFKQPNYEAGQWKKLAAAQRGYPGIQLEFLNKALIASPDDNVRYGVILDIVRVYVSTREFAKAIAALEGASQFLQTPQATAKAEKLKSQLQASMDKEQKMITAKDAQTRADDKKSRVAYLQAQVDAARKRGNDNGDVATFEQMIADLEKN
jgi:hypothetical protein